MNRMQVEPDQMAPPTDRAHAITLAAAWLDEKAVYLDTETTGLSPNDEVCDLAVVDGDGVVLFNSFIRPTVPIPLKVSRLHGIVDAMVKNAPGIDDVIYALARLLKDRRVVVYNAAFDQRLIEQSLDARGISFLRGGLAGLGHWSCAMEAYAMFHGQWDDTHSSYRWQRLGDAALQCGIALPGKLHRARADAEVTRQIVRHMAQAPDPKWEAT